MRRQKQKLKHNRKKALLKIDSTKQYKTAPENIMSSRSKPEQLALELGHSTSFAREDFLVTDGNRLAYEHLLSFPNWPGALTLITGPAKSGKSHLAAIWAAHAGALRPDLKKIEHMARAGGKTPLVLEDIERTKISEHGLFHLLNQSMREQRPLLITARDPVRAWPFKTDDVKSRARLAAHFSLAGVDDALLAQMFAKIFSDRQIEVEAKTISYVVARMERSPEEVVILAALMDRIAISGARAITRNVAAAALEQRFLRSGGQGQFWEDV
jgi:chromosomal replication initiation ATPase DnaA